MSDAFLSIREVTKRFPNGTIAVDRVSLDVREGEMLSFLGPSGCGKTTLLRLIAGFEVPTSGEIWLAGKRLDTVPPNRRGTTMVFQGYALFPHLSVFENVAYGLRVRRVSREDTTRRVERALGLVGLVGLGTRQPNQLSGGQQQRVAVARALILEPALLLFDEPLSNLDAKLREQMRFEIRALQQRLGITAVYVTHDQAEAMTLSDRIAVMRSGRIEQLGGPREIYEAPATRFVADFIGRATFLPGKVAEAANDRVGVELLGRMMRMPVAGALAVGDAAQVMVRSEAVEISEDAGDGIPAVVAQANFVGGLAQYMLRAGEHALVVTVPTEPGSIILAEGASVRLRLRPELLRAFPA
ncbi:MAG: ABC transporter ATP-binding protein [Chloroflexi bacterium]|nr:ABC transporter ATP-binding protein [Chloroflexota bacterium]